MRKLEGKIVSDKMTKTVVVAVEHSRKHPRYLKYVKITKRLKAHDEKGEYHTGDQVVIQETRPISKDKRWIVIGRISGENKKAEIVEKPEAESEAPDA
ncbi:MAG: 30S ribosomal protein S17 [Candidatus Harrisonbacteria bacterium CG10_big_fil_rev_8_21_14_0_10_40_38]|uniref:Small ribosomal subunit protein uS17 n=1 Tax=Candidatus Harrisonbacteria bacterium CG10_big_fil_rev_8_21_14_0_10_40_38 TaxID=1974583 RepID=A0A2H0USF0_9BACT|nr:MAG: 30S ribosomal protein S17 [Candidatus Harrisonbacteria bacterium CG10_big_fil_rev_8_21_14_0_10_40_38]